MTMQSGNFASLLEPGLRQIFDTAVNRPRPMMEALYGAESSTKLQEHYQGMGATGLVPVFDGSVPYETLDAYYKTTITNVELAQGMVVQRALVDDDQYGEINRRAQRLGNSFDRTIERDAVDTFLYAFTDSGNNRVGQSVAGPDAVGLCSTAHPYSPVDTTNTQSNEGTYAFELANVDTVRQAMLNFTDDKGELLGVDPDTILIPAELEREATKIFGRGAIWEPDSGEYNRNMFEGKMTVLMWNRLTDANAWWMIDSQLMKQYLIWQWRIRPEFAQSEDFDGIQAKYRGYMRYGKGWTHYQWCYGSNPS